MILEIKDIIGGSYAVGHTLPLPPGTTLGYVFNQDERLRQVIPCVHQVMLNGVRVDNWQAIMPAADDIVYVHITPRDFGISAALIAAIQLAVQIVSVVVSVVMFIVSMFNRPQPPKSNVGPRDSTTYSWDGIKTSFSPGAPVAVNYGEHVLGGQLLGMAIDVEGTGDSDGRNDKQTLSMLLGLGVGIITDVGCIKLNGILFSNFSDTATWDWRAGYSSQGILTGFDRTRNTFADGREVDSVGITYSTLGTSVAAIQLQIAALNGLAKYTSGGGFKSNETGYSVEYKITGTNTWAYLDPTRAFAGKTRSAIWDAPTYTFSEGPHAWDVRLKWLYTREKDKDKAPALYKIWLRNVTEIVDRTESFSNTALLAIRAVATSQIQGGVPNVNVVVKGLKVRAYSDETTHVTTWTSNPAWCLLDYMTNSRYGMGAFITTSMVNLQSFIDFAALCNSQVPNGVGSLEAQHVLDLTMDKRRPHWNWVQDILGLYRSSIIYSQGKYKIVSDRADLPVRQVFHGGNIAHGTFQLTLGTLDPIKPNQATITYPNRDLEFNLDTLYVQNSASVLGALDPIKDFDMSLVGVSRTSEAVREGNWQLDRRRQQVREAKFITGLEALAVEPGDHCRVGIPTTNFDLGYGGRLTDGSINHVVLDRPVDVRSGRTYELILWHTATDSLETRTVATTPASGRTQHTTLVVSPTQAFGTAAVVGDRWAMGVTSEDLMRGLVKSVRRDDAGRYELVVQEFVMLNPTTPVLTNTAWWGIAPLNASAAQPISVVGCATASIRADGSILVHTNIDVVPAPPEEGGVTTVPGTTESVTLGGSHATPNNALNQDFIRFLSGSQSVLNYLGTIAAWNGTTRVATVNPAFAADGVPSSGTKYMLIHQAGNFAGFDLLQRSVVASNYAFATTVWGTEYDAASDTASGATVYKVVPFTALGIRNTRGCWELTIDPASETTAPPMPDSLSITSQRKTVFVDATFNTPLVADFAGIIIDLIKTSTVNYISSPASLTTAVWSTISASLSLVSSPGDVTEATYGSFKATETATLNSHYIMQSRSLAPNLTLKLTADVLAGSRDFAFLQLGLETNSHYIRSAFDVRSGNLGALSTVGSATVSSRSIVALGSNWYRCAVVGKVSNSYAALQSYIGIAVDSALTITYSGDGNSFMFFSRPVLQTYADSAYVRGLRVSMPTDVDTTVPAVTLKGTVNLNKAAYGDHFLTRVKAVDYSGNQSGPVEA